MKPAASNKSPGTPTPPPLNRQVPLLVRVALVFLLTTIGLIILMLVIMALSGLLPQSAGQHQGSAAAAAQLPTLAAVVPTPIIIVPSGTGGEVTTLPTPTLASAAAAALETTPPLPPADQSPPAAAGPEPPQRTPLNGLAYEQIIVLPDDVIATARQIYQTGQLLGRRPIAYAKVGDSTVENPHFMARFDTGPYNLGSFAHLQPVVDHFLGSHARDSLAVRIAQHSWSANDPAWADKSLCLPNETPVQCEIRVHNPAILLIRLGTNDIGVPAMFDSNIRQIVDTAIAAGVIPVIGTKGDRHEGSNENNDILRRVAADYRIPLWDYDQVAGTLPARGLDVDMAHMATFYSHDYSDPTAFTRGHAMHNLTALMMLDALWRLVIQS